MAWLGKSDFTRAPMSEHSAAIRSLVRLRSDVASVSANVRVLIVRKHAVSVELFGPNLCVCVCLGIGNVCSCCMNVKWTINTNFFSRFV